MSRRGIGFAPPVLLEDNSGATIFDPVNNLRLIQISNQFGSKYLYPDQRPGAQYPSSNPYSPTGGGTGSGNPNLNNPVQPVQTNQPGLVAGNAPQEGNNNLLVGVALIFLVWALS